MVPDQMDGFDALVDGLPESWRAVAPALRARWQELRSAALTAWPNVTVDPDELGSRIGQVLAEYPSIAEGFDTIRVGDLYLALACARGDSNALAMVESDHLKTADAELRRLGIPEADIQDVKQRVRHKLLVSRPGDPARVLSYSGRGDLRGFVRVALVREALNHLQARKKNHSSEEEVLQRIVSAEDEPEMQHLKQHYRQHFAEAFRKALSELSNQDRTVLKMHLADGMSIDEIGRVFNVHRATAARWLARTQEALLVGTRDKLKGRLDIDSMEFESIMRLIHSRLDVSIIKHLGSKEE